MLSDLALALAPVLSDLTLALVLVLLSRDLVVELRMRGLALVPVLALVQKVCQY